MIDLRGVVRRALPVEYREQAKYRYRALARPLLERRYAGDARYCPVCEHHVSTFLPAGIVPRENARCPICGALERHRLLWLYLTERTDLLAGARKRVLHVAPEQLIERRLRALPQLSYLSADLLSRRVMVRMDITDIQFPAKSFDVILCNHVLEHVPDDARALAELYRVLAPGGWAILQVPIGGDVTDEDPSVSDPAERLRRFGQRDHVRIYGRDYRARLERAGFRVTVDDFASRLDAESATRMGIVRDELVYRCDRPLEQAATNP